MQALEVTDKLNFTEAIQFPRFPDVDKVWIVTSVHRRDTHHIDCVPRADPDQAFNFTLLDNIQREINGLTLATFGYNKTQTDQGFVQIVSLELLALVALMFSTSLCAPQNAVSNTDGPIDRSNIGSVDVGCRLSASPMPHPFLLRSRIPIRRVSPTESVSR